MAGKHDIPSSLQEFIIDKILPGKQIGRGAHGRILDAKWEGATVAIKEIHSIFIDEVSEPEFQAFKSSFLQECEQSSRLRHPNIVRFFGIYWPPRARAPSLVMERLHCSLTSLLEQNPVLSIGIKLSIIRDVSLGLRYLHTRTPIIIHRDLSSNNVLISKAMEGKIGDLGTVRLVDPRKQSRMTKAPGTVDFMPPEALAAGEDIKYERELDVFSFGCVMLHTLSHQWPTPSEPVVTDPITSKMKPKSEIERRSSYFDKISDKIDRKRSGALITVIKSCLNNIPKKRASIVTVCNKLPEGFVDDQYFSTNDSDPSSSALKQEIERKDAEIQNNNIQIHHQANEISVLKLEIEKKGAEIQHQANEMEVLKSDIIKLQMQLKTHNPVHPKAEMLCSQVTG